MEKTECIFISVVRDFVMYNKCITNNEYCKNFLHICIDNNKENLGIPTRYNQFLDSYDYEKPAWFIFCHEDWELKEDIARILHKINKHSIYGNIGTFCKKKKNQLYIYTRGHNISCNKDGSNKVDFGPRFCLKKELVDTVDCQCLIVHSDLIKKYHLRFDEHLQFHFYAEEFCIMASEKYNIPSYALSIDSIHYSFGTINEAFHDAVSYVKSKYSNCSHPYSAICDNTIIGNVNTIGYPKKEFWKYFLYQRKITKSGKEVIKIFKIPVYSKKISKF